MFSRKLVQPDTDLTQADFELRSVRDRAVTGDWVAAQSLMAATGHDWELRGRRLAVLSAAVGYSPQWLDAWEAAAPNDPTVAILRADALIAQAGLARGDLSAQNTTREQFRRFDRLSNLAAEAADRAVELNPLDPTPWVIMMTSMLADGRHRHDEFVAAMNEVIKRDPFNVDAHLMSVTFYCQKWYGSHDQMFAAARWPALAPAGSPVVLLPLLAHFEYALREFGFESRESSLAAKVAYFRRPDVKWEIDACAAKWQAAGEPRLSGRGIMLRHWLALANYLADRDRNGTRMLLQQIGPYLGNVPAYGYFWMQQIEGFDAVRHWAR